jgi:hypothetical protein
MNHFVKFLKQNLILVSVDLVKIHAVLCDSLKAEIASITEKLKNATPTLALSAHTDIEKELHKKNLEKNLYLQKAEKCYKVKISYRKKINEN